MHSTCISHSFGIMRLNLRSRFRAHLDMAQSCCPIFFCILKELKHHLAICVVPLSLPDIHFLRQSFGKLKRTVPWPCRNMVNNANGIPWNYAHLAYSNSLGTQKTQSNHCNQTVSSFKRCYLTCKYSQEATWPPSGKALTWSSCCWSLDDPGYLPKAEVSVISMTWMSWRMLSLSIGLASAAAASIDLNKWDCEK